MTVDDDDMAVTSAEKASSRSEADERRFWRALKPASPPESPESAPVPVNSGELTSSVNPIDLAGDMEDLTEDELESRRDALRSMLAASEARQQGAMRSKRPTLAIGEQLLVANGPYKDMLGTVLDADFIHSRVNLQFDDLDEPQWVEFARIAAVLPG